MFRKLILPIVAGCGLLFAIFMVYRSTREPQEPPIATLLPKPPFARYVAGEGLIESIGENTAIGVPFPNLVSDITVHVGDHIRQGQLLFTLDTRQEKADLVHAQEQRRRAKILLYSRRDDFAFYRSLRDRRAVSKRDYVRAWYALQEAAAAYKEARARVVQLETVIVRSQIRSPLDGVVLQENLRVGEVANVNPFTQTPLMLVGSREQAQVRVNVAEEDAWRVHPGVDAVAFVRGNAAIKIPLEFAYIEPYIVPKRSLTGSDFERVDTRVLQVIYRFRIDDHPIYVGQLLDVYIATDEQALYA